MSLEKQKTIYLIPGLGADKRIFQNLVVPGYQLECLEWISPLKSETMQDYAKRWSEKIRDPEPYIIGLSFGGMLVVEMTREWQNYKAMIISSAKTGTEIPWYFRWAGKIGIHKLIPLNKNRKPIRLINWFLGIETPEEKKLIVEILRDTDTRFLRWAINQILHWRAIKVPTEIFHVHGRADRLLPARYANASHVVEGGGHFMLMNRSEQMNQVIIKFFSMSNENSDRLS